MWKIIMVVTAILCIGFNPVHAQEATDSSVSMTPHFHGVWVEVLTALFAYTGGIGGEVDLIRTVPNEDGDIQRALGVRGWFGYTFSALYGDKYYSDQSFSRDIDFLLTGRITGPKVGIAVLIGCGYRKFGYNKDPGWENEHNGLRMKYGIEFDFNVREWGHGRLRAMFAAFGNTWQPTEICDHGIGYSIGFWVFD